MDEAQVLAKLSALEQKVVKVGNEELRLFPSATAFPISDAPEGLLKGKTVAAGVTYRLTTIPSGAQVIALPGGDFILSIDPTMAKGSYALGWQLSTGIAGSKSFTVN